LRAPKTPQDKPLFLDKKLNVVKLNSTTRNFASLCPFLRGWLSLFRAKKGFPHGAEKRHSDSHKFQELWLEKNRQELQH
jgi:hypothetical protein